MTDLCSKSTGALAANDAVGARSEAAADACSAPSSMTCNVPNPEQMITMSLLNLTDACCSGFTNIVFSPDPAPAAVVKAFCDGCDGTTTNEYVKIIANQQCKTVPLMTEEAKIII